MAVSERTVGGKRRYQAEVFKDGVRVASKRFDTKAQAYAWHEEERARWRRGVGVSGQKTFGEVLDRFEADHVAGLRASTKARWAWFLEVFRKSVLSGVRMSEMTALDVDGFIHWLMKQPTAKSVNRESFVKEVRALSVVCQFFVDFEDERFVVPVTRRHLKMAKYKPTKAGKIRTRDKFIPVEDLRAWLSRLKYELDPVFHRMAVLQTVLGLRIGEVASLKWSAVDLDRGTIRVERTMEWTDADGKKVQRPGDAPKTEASNRTLPAPSVVIEALRAAKRDHPYSTVVFRTRRGRLVGYETVRQAYNRAFEREGLKWSATHILRHTHATLGLGAGRAEAVQSNLGHTSQAQMEAYGKAHLAVTNDIPEKVAALLLGGEEKDHVTFTSPEGVSRK